MEYVNLGRTGLRVSRLCLGTMTFGSTAWRPWILPEDASRPFIRHALDAGINFFDTADMYSRGVSEEIVGRALNDFTTRDQVVIATKAFFPMGDGPNDRGPSPASTCSTPSTPRSGGSGPTTSTSTRSTGSTRTPRSRRRWRH